MQDQKPSPRTDDFRLERVDGTLLVTFTPDGRSYVFRVEGGDLSEPETSPPQAVASDYADGEVGRVATDLARLALEGGPKG